MVTLDGYKYTFNGKGEYLLIETDDGSFTLQGRMEEANSINNGTSAQGTVFTALVAKDDDSDTVQFQLLKTLIPIVDGEEVYFDGIDVAVLNNLTVRKKGEGSYSAAFTSGASLEVVQEFDSNGKPFISTLLVSLPETFKNRTSGLMGSFNGNQEDNLSPRDGGDPLPLSSNLSTIHWGFGITCEHRLDNFKLYAIYVCVYYSFDICLYICMYRDNKCYRKFV